MNKSREMIHRQFKDTECLPGGDGFDRLKRERGGTPDEGSISAQGNPNEQIVHTAKYNKDLELHVSIHSQHMGGGARQDTEIVDPASSMSQKRFVNTRNDSLEGLD